MKRTIDKSMNYLNQRDLEVTHARLIKPLA